MKTTCLLATVVMVLGAVLFAAEPATQPSKKTPINKMCAVNTKDEVDPTVTTEYKGKTIGFCCEDCIELFKKDPEKYMKGLK